MVEKLLNGGNDKELVIYFLDKFIPQIFFYLLGLFDIIISGYNDHESGRIEENPNGIPNNLMPYITQVAIGKLKELYVFGNNYPTFDGTGVRDYIHIIDLAKGYLKAIKKVFKYQRN